MFVYKFDFQYMMVDFLLIGVVDFYVKILEVVGGNIIGYFEFYVEDYE